MLLYSPIFRLASILSPYLEKLNSNNREDKQKQNGDDQNVENVLQWVNHALEHSLKWRRNRENKLMFGPRQTPWRSISVTIKTWPPSRKRVSRICHAAVTSSLVSAGWVLSKASFTRTRFPIETVSWPGNHIKNDTVSKSLHRTYPTVKSNCSCQGNLVLGPLRLVNWIWERVKSPYPCLPAIFCPTKHEFSQAESRIVVWLFSSLLCRSVLTKKSTFQDISLCLLLRYASWFIESKIHESCKSKVKQPQIKVVIVQQSAALGASFTIFTSQASQFCARSF